MYMKGLDCTLVMLSTMLMDTFFLWDRGRNDSKLEREARVGETHATLALAVAGGVLQHLG